MKILFLFPESPFPVICGQHVHACNLLRFALKRAQCGVVGFYRGVGGQDRWDQFKSEFAGVPVHALIPEAEGLARHRSRVLSFLQERPLTNGQYKSRAAFQAVATVLSEEDYELVHMDQHKLLPLREAVVGRPVLLVPHDAYSMFHYRAFLESKSVTAKMRAYLSYLSFRNMERVDYARCSLVAPVSGVDCTWLKAMCPGIRAAPLPIVVEQMFFDNLKPWTPRPVFPHIVCGGYFGFEPIALRISEFVERVYPALKLEFPDCRLTVWGRERPHRSVRRSLRRHPEVKMVSWADDYLAMIRSADIYVYPQVMCSGIQTKVQQIMAAGVPVVGRRETLDPIGVVSGENGWICRDCVGMCEAIRCLLRDPDRLRHIGLAGRALVQKQFCVEAVERQYWAIVSKLTEAPSIME